ncbi:hypothetical protein NMY22_g7534 [Coprinellus aureogranulatus]|nr:hypothetical protein NMY22_g7534 [Coprinellus aureogranulatus]
MSAEPQRNTSIIVQASCQAFELVLIKRPISTNDVLDSQIHQTRRSTPGGGVSFEPLGLLYHYPPRGLRCLDAMACYPTNACHSDPPPGKYTRSAPLSSTSMDGHSPDGSRSVCSDDGLGSANSIVPQETVLLMVFICALALGLSLLLLLKIMELRYTPEGRWSDKVDVAHISQEPWWKYPVFALLGRKLWRSRVPGQSDWLSIVRGISAVLAILMMIAFATYQIILSPVAEMGMVPHRQFRARFLPESIIRLENQANWTVAVMWETRSDAARTLAEAVTVDWDFDTDTYNGGPTCGTVVSIAGECDGPGLSNYECLQSRPDWVQCSGWGIAPTLQTIRIKIDFAGLFPPGNSAGGRRDKISDAARIYVGLAEEFDPVATATRPIQLFPGTDLLSVVDVVIRQRLSSPGLATLGFESHNSILIVDPVYTITNGFANSTSPDIGTISITRENIKSEWIVIQDFRAKSVLTGLSGVGGLGSFLSTLLVIFLGTSLMRAVMRSKEYSPLGLLHSGMSDKMAKACREKYPELEADILQLQKNPGVVAYLFDTLVDMGPIGHREVMHNVEGHSLPRENSEMVELVPFTGQKPGGEDVGPNLEKGALGDRSNVW